MRTLGILGALAIAAPLAAQNPTHRIGDILQSARDAAASQPKNQKRDKIPPGQLPPAGMCRIWIDGVPPGQQPAATDCQTAVANKPANARVIWGNQSAFPGRGRSDSTFRAGQSPEHGKANKGRGRGGDDENENEVDDERDDNRASAAGSIAQAANQSARSRHRGKHGDE
jgi:hypothetical protein